MNKSTPLIRNTRDFKKNLAVSDSETAVSNSEMAGSESETSVSDSKTAVSDSETVVSASETVVSESETAVAERITSMFVLSFRSLPRQFPPKAIPHQEVDAPEDDQPQASFFSRFAWIGNSQRGA